MTGPFRRTVAVLATLAALGLLTACRPFPRPSSRSGALRIGLLADERTINPYTYVTGYPGWNLLMLVYDSLFQLDTENRPRPWLARTHEVSDAGLRHTLTLRDDVRWHDGRPLTSADVAFTLGFYQTHAHGRWSAAVRGIAGIETPHAATVVIRLAAPDPGLATRLLADVPILPAHLWKEVVDPRAADVRVGSGPYRLVEYQPDRLYRLAANPDYFAGTPLVEELVLPIVKEQTTLFSALETGALHAATRELGPELVGRFARREREGFGLVEGPGYGTTLLQFNTERAPWNDSRVRRAVALAIDTDHLVDTVMLGRALVGNPGWLHPSHPAHDPGLRHVVDVDAARRLLDAAGIVDHDGDGVREFARQPVRPVLLAQANDPARVRAAELIAAAVRAIGIEARVRAEETTSLTAKVWPDFDVSRGRNFDWSMFGWSPPVLIDPLRITALVDGDVRHGTNNIGGFRHPEADRLSARLRMAADEGTQRTVLQQLEALIARERPFVLLWYADLAFAYRRDVFDGWRFQAGQGIFHKQSFVAAPRGVP